MTDLELFEKFYSQVGVSLTRRQCYHDLCEGEVEGVEEGETIEVYEYSICCEFGVVCSIFTLEGKLLTQCVYERDMTRGGL